MGMQTVEQINQAYTDAITAAYKAAAAVNPGGVQRDSQGDTYVDADFTKRGRRGGRSGRPTGHLSVHVQTDAKGNVTSAQRVLVSGPRGTDAEVLLHPSLLPIPPTNTTGVEAFARRVRRVTGGR